MKESARVILRTLFDWRAALTNDEIEGKRPTDNGHFLLLLVSEILEIINNLITRSRRVALEAFIEMLSYATLTRPFFYTLVNFYDCRQMLFSLIAFFRRVFD